MIVLIYCVEVERRVALRFSTRNWTRLELGTLECERLSLASDSQFRHNELTFASESGGGDPAGNHRLPTGNGPIAQYAVRRRHHMSAGRRGLILSVAFLGLAIWLCPALRLAEAQPGPAQFQDPTAPRHNIWRHQLTPEQIRELLAKFGQDDGKSDPVENLLRQLIQDKNPNAPPEQVDAAVKRFMNDKEFHDRVMDLAQKQKNQMRDDGRGKQPPNFNREDLAKIEKLAKSLPDGGKGEPFKLPDEPFPPFVPNKPPENSTDLDPRFPARPEHRPADRHRSADRPQEPTQVRPAPAERRSAEPEARSTTTAPD